MSDVNETLQQLVQRRLREIGAQRGRPEGIPLTEAFRAVPEPEVTYELIRRVATNGHTAIGEPAVRTLAAMLRIDDLNVIRTAARQKPHLGEFVLPPRANQLTQPQRRAVLGVVDAILTAGGYDVRERRGAQIHEFPDPNVYDNAAAREHSDPTQQDDTPGTH